MSAFKKKTIGKVLTGTQYGLSLLSSERGNYSIIGMKDIQSGRVWIDEMIRVQLDEHEAQRYVLKRGDVLLNRTNSNELVGSAESTGRRERQFLLRILCV